MVKPTLKPDSDKKEEDLKDDKLKEWGILPGTVVIDDSEKQKDKKDAEAAIELDNLETEIGDSSRPFLGKCCLCFAVLAILVIVSCTVGSFLYFHYGNKENHKWKGWCSVRYGDDDLSAEEGQHGPHHGDMSSSEEHGPPQPGHTEPGQRQCDQETEIDIDQQFNRIERPQQSDSERITILHDYKTNISAYRLWNSNICYVTWIESEVLMDPQEFWNNMQDPYFLNQYFRELTMMYQAVLPAIPTPLHEQENGKYGEYLDGPTEFLCVGTQTYWIEKIPAEEIEEFMQVMEQVIQVLMQLVAWAGGEETGMIDNGGYGGEEIGQWDEPFGDHDWHMDDDRDHDLPPMEDAWPLEDDEQGGRKRRGAGILKHEKQGVDAAGILMAAKLDPKEVAECLQINWEKLSEIGDNSRLVTRRVAAPCFMKILRDHLNQ